MQNAVGGGGSIIRGGKKTTTFSQSARFFGTMASKGKVHSSRSLGCGDCIALIFQRVSNRTG